MTQTSLRASWREAYWTYSKHLRRIRCAMGEGKRAFGKEIARTHLAHLLGTVRPRHGDNQTALSAAVQWLLRAQAATPDDGVSLGYFPCDTEMGWRPSYPETTGYIIPTLLDYARLYQDDAVRERALAMGRWEIRIQMASGAVQGGPVCPPEKQQAAVFNTGMVLQGLTAAYRESGQGGFLDAGRRAADFLVSDMDQRGHFRTHGSFVTQDEVKTYNVLCAWAMYRFGEDSGETMYQDAALRAVHAAVGEQAANGWFRACCLTHPAIPLTHTIGYTLQGILEVAALAGNDEYLAAARRGADPIIELIHPNGYLPGRFAADWSTSGNSSCLTGSAQLAIVFYRLFELFGDERYRRGANKLVGFLRALQRLDSDDDNINGAIAGSFPLLGQYMTAGYPNWATKYFADALILQNRLGWA